MENELSWGDFTDEVPGLRAFFRGGKIFVGDNREWLASKAKTEYVSFFDCDDVMHPQRIEFLDRMLREHPSTEALLTGYNRRNFGDATAYLKDKSFDPDEKDIFALRWPYEALWEAPPIKKDWNGRKWVRRNFD
eukprot:Selendium_serpulae@DN6405_c0_g1_i1.p1